MESAEKRQWRLNIVDDSDANEEDKRLLPNHCVELTSKTGSSLHFRVTKILDGIEGLIDEKISNFSIKVFSAINKMEKLRKDQH
jgi:hypothetical protein